MLGLPCSSTTESTDDGGSSRLDKKALEDCDGYVESAIGAFDSILFGADEGKREPD
jgi:hypothetical protein